ncbi:MAG: SDR family oxidoreductase [Chitinophagales bacterium]|nr:SDR family oxidoreductase [Chitinophagales bacterium]
MNVVVTGGSKGIGKSIAKQFFDAGHSVIICARNEKTLIETQEVIDTKQSGRLNVFTCDLSKEEDINAFSKYIHQHFETVDILVNNTGVFLPGSILEEADSNYIQQMNTNVFSAYLLSKLLLPLLLKSNNGQIFNICSVASIKAYPNGGSYGISKFALLGFTKTLREELKTKGIKVTAVMPGATFTSSWEGVDLPEDRFMPADDVAQMVYAISQLSKQSVVEEIIMRPQLGDI